MAAPVFVASVASAFSSATTPKSATAALTISAGDVVVGGAGTASDLNANENYTFGPGTWTEQTIVQGSSNNQGAAQTATQSPSAGALTPTIAAVNGGANAMFFGASWAQFSASDGVGAQAQGNNGTGSGAPSWSITTTQDNSAIFAIIVDWNASDGTTRTWSTVNGVAPSVGNGYERTYFRDSAQYTIYVAYWPDAGTAGAKTIGMTTPSAMRWVGAAVEIKGQLTPADPGAGYKLLSGVGGGDVLLTGDTGALRLTSQLDTPEQRGHLVNKWQNQAFNTTLTINIAPSANNHAVLMLQHQSQSITSVVDNLGANWTAGPDQNTGTEGRVGIWYREDLPAGVTSVTITAAASTALIGQVAEVVGDVTFLGGSVGAYGSTADPAAVTVASMPSGSITFSVAGYFQGTQRSEVVPVDYQALHRPDMQISTTYFVSSFKELATGETAGPDYGATATLTNFATVTAVFGPSAISHAGASTMTAPSSLIAGADRTAVAAVSMTAPSSLASAATLEEFAVVSMTAPSALASAAVRTTSVVVSMTAPSSLASDAVASKPAASAMTAPSTLTVAATRTTFDVVAMTAPSVLGAAGLLTAQALVTMTAPSVLAAAAVRTTFGIVAMTAPSTLAAGATPTRLAAAALTAPSTLTVSASLTAFAGVAMTAPSVLNVQTGESATMSAPSTLTVAAFMAEFAAVAMTAPSTLVTAGVKTTFGAVSMTAASTLTVGPFVVRFATVSMTAASTLTPAGTRVTSGVVAMTAASVLAANAVAGTISFVSMSAPSSLVTAADVTRMASVAMSAPSALTAGVVASRAAAATLLAASVLIVDATRSTTAGVTMSAPSTLSTAATVIRLGAVVMTAASILSANPKILVALFYLWTGTTEEPLELDGLWTGSVIEPLRIDSVV